MKSSHLYTGVALWGWVLAASPALAVHWSENVGWRAQAMGGIPLAVVDETTEYNLFNFQNPAGLAFLPRKNRLDLGGYVFIPKESDTLMRTDLIAPGGEYQGLILTPSEDFTFQIDPEARYYPNIHRQDSPPSSNIHPWYDYFGWTDYSFSHPDDVFHENQRVHMLMDYQAAGAYQLLPGLALGARVMYKRPVQDVWEEMSRVENIGGQIGLGWDVPVSDETKLILGISAGINDAEDSGETVLERAEQWKTSWIWSGSGTVIIDIYSRESVKRLDNNHARLAVQGVIELINGISAALVCEVAQSRKESEQRETWIEDHYYDEGNGLADENFHEREIGGSLLTEYADTSSIRIIPNTQWWIPMEQGSIVFGVQLHWMYAWEKINWLIADDRTITTIEYDNGIESTAIGDGDNRTYGSETWFELSPVTMGFGYQSNRKYIKAGVQVTASQASDNPTGRGDGLSGSAGLEAWLMDWLAMRLGIRMVGDWSGSDPLNPYALSTGFGLDFGATTVDLFGRIFIDDEGAYLYSEAFASTSVKW